jgi:predicted metal-dependent phosphoesterase TrpH
MVSATMSEPLVGIIHVHSTYSHDGRDTLSQIHELAVARGIGFVGLTDHAEDLTAERYSEMRAECGRLSDERVLLIPGLEYRFTGLKGMHLLALGLTRWIEPATPAEFVEQTAGCAGFTIAAHPGLYGYRPPDAVRHGIDAIEVWNAAYNTRYLPDPRAIRLLREIRRERPAVVGTAGLDQHDGRNDRRTRVVVRTSPDRALAALKAGEFENRGATMSFGPRCDWPTWAVAGLSVARAAFDGIEGVQDRWARARQRRSA